MSFLNKKSFFLKSFSLSCFVFIGFFLATNSYAASLYFSPAVGGYDVGNVFKVSVLVDTQYEAINSAETSINFPADLLEVVSLSKTNSIFSFWVQDPTFSNVSGDISFSGGLATPGFNGANGKLLEIVFKAKKSGLASLLFSPGSVRANDGLGTDVLKNVSQANFTLSSGNQVPTAVSGNTPSAPAISSPTNPDQNKWYNNSNPKFVWPVSSSIIADRILYDKYPNTSPSVLYSPAISEKTVNNLKDGIYYFHARLENTNGWGGVSNFKFQIDTKNPDSFVMTKIQNNASSSQAEFSFNATDTLSGIDHYEIQIDNGNIMIWNDNGSHIYQTPELNNGEHTIFVKAFDKANNFLISSSSFSIAFTEPITSKEGFPLIQFLTPFFAAVPFIVIIILIILIIWYAIHKFLILRRQIQRETYNAERNIHKAFDLLGDDLRNQIDKLNKDKSIRDLTIVKNIKRSLSDAEALIEKEIQDIERKIN